MAKTKLGQYLETELGRVFYQVHGPEDAPAVVFTHGVAMDHRTFAPQVEALKDDYRVVTWDMPYHGRSDSLDKSRSFSATSTDLLAKLLDSLGIEQAAFVGLSLGSYITRLMSIHYPERVGAEVHVSGSSMQLTYPKFLRFVIPVIKFVFKLLPESIMARTFASNKALKEETVAYLVEAVEQTGKDGLTHLMCEMIRDMTVPLPEPAEKPRLIVYGDHEKPFVIKASIAWHERVPGSELVEVQNAHHIVNQDNPEAFNVALLAFLKKL